MRRLALLGLVLLFLVGSIGCSSDDTRDKQTEPKKRTQFAPDPKKA